MDFPPVKSQAVLDGVPQSQSGLQLKVRKGAFDSLTKGSGALEQPK